MVLTIVALAARPPSAHAQAIGYTLTPAAGAVRWDDALGLQNKALYGGAVSLDFEQWLSLQGYFLTNTGVRLATDQLDLPGDIIAGLGDRRLRVRSYGGNFRVPLTTGDIAPYLAAGGGVIEFRPDDGDRTRQTALNVGGGLRIALGEALHLDLFAHDAMFRLDRLALFERPEGAPGMTDPGADDLRHNLVIGGGLGIPLGASRTGFSGPARGTQWGLIGTSFALEPMAGRMVFDSDALADQELAGIRGGIDLGRFVGLRGFYWRGVGSDFTRTEPVQSWGGEAQVRLNPGSGIAPFLLLGGGQLDFTRDYRNTAGDRVADETALILGGGVVLPVGERLALNLAARDYVFGQNVDLGDVSRPDDLVHNWMFSAGLRFSLGGREGSDIARARAARQARMTRELDRARAARDSLERALAQRPERVDTVRIAPDRVSPVRTPGGADTARLTATERGAAGAYVSGRDVTIPVPAEGELYVRYGPDRAEEGLTTPDARAGRRGATPPAAVVRADRTMSDQELRDVVREAIREELGDRAELDHRRMPTEPRRPADAEPERPRTARPIPMPDTARGARAAAGDVERPRMTKDEPREVRIPVVARDTRADRDVAALSDVRAEVRALLDSIRLEVRTSREPLDPRAQAAYALLEHRIVARVDSVLRMHQADARAAAEEQARADREREMARRTRMDVQVRPTRRSPVMLSYAGVNVTDGVQGVLGLRADLGAVGTLSSLRFVPEVALGWGTGARSVMAAGNVQLGLPTLRIGGFPRFTPHVSGGAGLIHFNHDLRGRDGLDGVVNLGYGAAIDLWDARAGITPAVLVVEHQGVDLFSLNRLIAGIRWRF